MTAISDLVQRLKDDVLQVDGRPTDGQYNRAVRSSVSALSRDSGMRSVVVLSIVSGVAAYDLPAAFQEMISFGDPATNQAWRHEGILITSAGLVPVSDDFEEGWFVLGGTPPTITFHPTPTYDTTRDVWYRAEHVLVGDDYTTIDDEAAEILLLLAASMLLEIKANTEAQNAWMYQQGDVRVQKDKVAGALRDQAKGRRDEYQKRIDGLNRSVGGRARYSARGK